MWPVAGWQCETITQVHLNCEVQRPATAILRLVLVAHHLPSRSAGAGIRGNASTRCARSGVHIAGVPAVPGRDLPQPGQEEMDQPPGRQVHRVGVISPMMKFGRSWTRSSRRLKPSMVSRSARGDRARYLQSFDRKETGGELRLWQEHPRADSPTPPNREQHTVLDRPRPRPAEAHIRNCFQPRPPRDTKVPPARRPGP